MKVLIIGGVAAGTKVAAKLKREDRDHEVTVFTKEYDISYAGCGLPYYVGNLIEDKGELIVNTPETFKELTGATVHTGMEVTKVNPEEKNIEVLNLETDEKTVHEYDKLVISTGASPIKPPFEGVDLEGVYTMRNPDDAIAIKEALERDEIKRAVIVGGGFIGLELAENLTVQGVNTSIIDMAEMVPPGFEPEFVEHMQNHLAENRIMTFMGTKLDSIIGEERVEKIKTDKNVMKTDAVILSIGVSPNTQFLADSGIEMMPNKTVKVNKYLETNKEDIYAVGDCVSVTNRITGEPAWSPMGSTANITGRIAAQNINGESIEYGGVLGTGVAQLPGLNIGRTGLTEEAAKDAGFDVISVVTVIEDIAHYYPGVTFLTVKMLADKNTKKLLGLQVLGEGAVDKMIDIAVTGITMDADLETITQMDFAYAPPFSSAIHPFSHTANTLLNKIEGTLESVTPLQYMNDEVKDYEVIDASIAPSLVGYPFLDLNKIEEKPPTFGKEDKVLLVCSKGKRAYLLQNRLKHLGYKNTLVLEGGWLLNKI